MLQAKTRTDMPMTETMTATPLLNVDRVTLRYKTPNLLITATENVSFSVAQSDRFVLLGPSGCGKSTLLKAIGGYMTPTAGRIEVKGQPVKKPGADRMMVFQEFDQLLPWKTVLENVMFPLTTARRLPRSEAEAIARDYIDKVKLTRAVDTYPHMLSGGMKQRVAIARGMAMQPDILLMDEPFAALDALTRDDMQRLLADVWRETRKTVIYVTHNVAEAVYLADRVIVMSPHPGTVKADIRIPLDRPRDPLSAEFLEWQKNLLRQLGHEPGGDEAHKSNGKATT